MVDTALVLDLWAQSHLWLLENCRFIHIDPHAVEIISQFEFLIRVETCPPRGCLWVDEIYPAALARPPLSNKDAAVGLCDEETLVLCMRELETFIMKMGVRYYHQFASVSPNTLM